MSDGRSVDGRAGIDAVLVKRLVAAQFPWWSHLSVDPVESDGWDNRTYRLGPELSIRLPTAAGYATAVKKEARWLPVLTRSVRVPIPVVVAVGQPGEGYPYPWSVRRWLAGDPAHAASSEGLVGLAVDVATFLGELRHADPTGGPVAGEHSFFRGSSLTHYTAETHRAISTLNEVVDRSAAESVWNESVSSIWQGPAVWFHGDVSAGNLLVEDGRLSAVIDFGTCGVGDPACDLTIAWTLFAGVSREAFTEAVGLDPATWARARGWALWKALITAADDESPRKQRAAALDTITDVLTDGRTPRD